LPKEQRAYQQRLKVVIMHPTKRVNLLFASILVLNALIHTAAFALPTDRQKAINIEADTALRNDKTGLTVYEGAVNIVQGTINIRADKVMVHSTRDKVSKIVCIGTPAHYQQIQNAKGGLVTARANTIEYNLAEDVIALLGNASLSQNGSILKGNSINYDLKKEYLEAHGDITGKRRIEMVIPPSQQEGIDEWFAW
jgi:lipopolysaccharide export system protein LptA